MSGVEQLVLPKATLGLIIRLENDINVTGRFEISIKFKGFFIKKIFIQFFI